MSRAAVIGAGPAGNLAARALALRGWDVTLIESRPFPRIKVCGEFISPAATPLLELVLPPAKLAALGARRVDRFQLNQGDGPNERTIEWPLGQPAWALSRSRLDAVLLEASIAAGVRVLQPLAVSGVEYHDRTISIRAADGSRLETDIVIHADGGGRLDPAGPVPRSAEYVGHKCHLRLPPGMIEGVWIRTARDGYLGLIEVEGGIATAACVTTAAATRACRRDTDALLHRLWPRYQSTWRTSDWHSCPVPRSRYVRPGHPRSFRIGNAAAAVDPVGGEGIGLALWSASVAAAAIGPPERGEALDRRLGEAQHAIEAAYAARLRTRLPACRFAAAALMRPRLIRALWPLLRSRRLARDPWLWLTGKRDGIGPDLIAALGPYA